LPEPLPSGVCSSGGIDSGSLFFVPYKVLQRRDISPSRLKSLSLDLGNGPDVEQARAFLSATGLSMFLEEIQESADDLDVEQTLRVLEDYKSLDVECAAMGLLLCQGIRERYPDQWVLMVDHDWLEHDPTRYNTARVLACGASRAEATARARSALDSYEGHGCRYTGTIRGPMSQLKQFELELKR
jgi:hypothetical protein